MTDERLRFEVPGEPVGKGRPRFGNGRTYTDPKTEAYEQTVAVVCAVAARRARWTFEDTDRFSVTIELWRRYRDKGPDLDNCAKALLDGMNGLAYRDDAHVRKLNVSVHHAAKEQSAHVLVRKLERHE